MDNEKINFNVWRDFFGLVKSYKKHFFLLSIIMIGVGTLDAVFPLFTKYLIDDFIIKGTLTGLNKFILVFFVVIITQGISVFLFLAMAGKIETNMSYDIRKKGFEKLQVLPLSYYDENAIGWLMARMTSDINRLSETISWGLVDYSWGITMMTAITISFDIVLLPDPVPPAIPISTGLFIISPPCS